MEVMVVRQTIPDSVSWRQIAKPENSDWALFQYSPDSDWSAELRTSKSLSGSLYSAERYPPAIALAREAIYDAWDWEEEEPSIVEFTDQYERYLNRYLARQTDDRYILAQATCDEARYLRKGEWYWVLKARDARRVAWWVSRDYQIYQNNLGDFALSEAQIERLLEE